MIRLHHMGESLCSQRVRLVLAEKGLVWESALLPPPGLRSPDYLSLNPAGVVPTLEHDGHVLVESRIICEYLEDAFPQPALMPLRPLERYRVRRWCKVYDDSLHLALFALTFLCWMRERYLAMARDDRREALPGRSDPVKRQVAWTLCEQGWNSDIAAVAVGGLKTLIADLDSALAGSRWLAGERYSLADIDMLAAVQRLGDLGLSGLWDEWAFVSGWLDRARSRPSFNSAIVAWRTDEAVQSHRVCASLSADRLSTMLIVE